MKLHIFNPEHDMALSHQYVSFPKAAQLLSHGLGFIPALWAEDGDIVVVDDMDYAERALHRLYESIADMGMTCTFANGCSFADGVPSIISRCRFVTPSMIRNIQGINRVSPWGWDKFLVGRLKTMGIDGNLLPETDRLAAIRGLAHRDNARQLLGSLVQLSGTTGIAHYCSTEREVNDFLSHYGDIVIKAPWSGSGRGIRFISGSLNTPTLGWLTNILRHQGGVMVEPRYSKVLDFGMEFMAQADGTVSYCGLSLFSASNGAYTGNILANEEYKRSVITHYISDNLLTCVISEVESEMSLMLRDKYVGPFGIDMMIVDSSDCSCPYLLHPCVEINLRLTMGHAALAVVPSRPLLMAIDTRGEFMMTITDNVNM